MPASPPAPIHSTARGRGLVAVVSLNVLFSVAMYPLPWGCAGHVIGGDEDDSGDSSSEDESVDYGRLAMGG
jgi:hypothetical protein